MSKEIKLSATRIHTFLECKQKYWFNYHEQLPKMSNPSFKLGLVCHETLEYAGGIWKEKGKFDPEDIKNILSVYDTFSVRNGLGYDVHLEGKGIIEKKLAGFWLNAGKKIISLEETFGMGLGDDVRTVDDVPLIGAMDMVVELDHDSLMVVDYKTSTTRPTGEDVKNDIQLSIYDLVASIKWPQYKRIILRLDFLKSEPLDTYRNPNERGAFCDYVKILHDEMVSFQKRDAAPSLNLFCSWCDFKDYCSAYRKAYEKTNYIFEAAEKFKDADLVNEWTRVRDTKKILEGRERELAMLVMERVRRAESSSINNGDYLLYIRSNRRTDYDVDTVFKNVPIKEFLKMVRLNKTDVEKYMDKRPAVKDSINSKVSHQLTAPFLAQRKISDKKGGEDVKE